ncbi:N-(5'-phosphoribosyl)anthranilate isomerase [Lactobacillus pentosus] [Lactiplantibacillus mudanjiangensis]|uniref:phosphoribosylanthranilate isomerase n=1 Tax=Lactiplantibacillus mudanjiangensis TaxID=1296538 RepID=UPI0010148A02|nr:phosphoribosylanthranilate isomerase [Lactiplantibacillus mudanjiangensis]VDG18425.1 N-(5'-phosphoribosyl)anthranilate isomerase [Lactobacillus pentosus] [Lactiplantibacillus mudanjiangensis]VDG33680.1 N-(5'-phosphoribosyl)anthranilate isomerase [Lactobacillus pentosus] [Lactiplantibacillus mudanjiangensis]
MPRIKLCGLRRLVDIDYANQVQPDLVGVVFAPESFRAVTGDQAQRLRQRLDAKIPMVGVFTTTPLARIMTLVQAGIIQQVQLHGPINDDRVTALQAAKIPVMQAVTPVNATQSQANTVLLDNVNPGSGQPLAWSAIARPKRPFFLAGGLTPDNVTNAIQVLQPAGVDVSSGIETAGVKDFKKIQAFMRSVRNVNNN